MIKEKYSLKEWEDKEKYYIKAVTDIALPPLPTLKEIMDITSKLDAMYTEASFEYAQIKRKDEVINMDLKNAEAECFSTIKQQQLTAGTKITENDVKGLVKTYISTHPMKGYKSDLYTLAKFFLIRRIFMERVIKSISEKKQSLIIDTAMLKLEDNFSGAKDVKE